MRQCHRAATAILLGTMLSVLAGCGGSQHDPLEKYYLLSANVKIPYWQTAANGLMRAASQLQVRGEVVGPETYDPQAEQQDMHWLIGLQPTPVGNRVFPAEPAVKKDDSGATHRA